MAGEIKEAVARYKERQDSAGLNADAISAGEDALLAAFRRALVGLDLDASELQEAAAAEAPVLATAMAIGMSPIAVATSQWVTGVIVGLLIADARDGDGASA